MEIYLTIDEYMDTFMGLLDISISTAGLYFVYKGFKLAEGWRKQHEEKLILEKSVTLSEKIIQKLYLIQSICKSIFALPDFIAVQLIRNSYSNVPTEFRDKYCKLLIIEERLKSKEKMIVESFAEIEVWLDFLKDKKTKVLFEEVKINFSLIKLKIENNTQQLAFLSEIELSQMSEQERRIVVHEKEKEFKRFVPISYENEGFIEIVNFRESLLNFKNYILEKHVP